MKELSLSVGEPFTSPAWGGNFVVFATESGAPVPEPQTKEYMRRCCKYARHYEAWLVPERFILMGYQCMCLISPEGKVIGAQKGLYGGPTFKAKGKKSTALEVFPTEFGSIALCVDVDIFRPEVARIAGAMGAQFIICSQTVKRADYGSHVILTGVWNAAQLAGVYVISVSNQFNCVCAPIDISPLEDGFVTPPNLKMPLTQILRAERLESSERLKPLNRKLYALHRSDLIGR